MSFIKYSNDFNANTHTLVDNVFISEYMPYAADTAVKIYLYGLCLCQNGESPDNDIEIMARALSLEPEDIINAFIYWQEFGLVHIIKQNPVSVRYLPVRSGAAYLKKLKPSKYADFNVRLQDMAEGRMITPAEYNEYYNVMESLHIEPDAMLLTARYCMALKGGAVGYPYILTVAKNWAAEGVRTSRQIEDRLAEYAAADGNLKELFRVMKIKRAPDFEDRQMYMKWTKSLGFDLPAVMLAAKSIKGRGGTQRLDALLTGFYSSRILTADAMRAFIENKDKMYDIAREVCKRLGVYYENLSYMVETYILEWTSAGFSEEALLLVADLLFRRSIKRPEKMDDIIKKLAEKGLTGTDAVKTYFEKSPDALLGSGSGGKTVPFIDKVYSKDELDGLFNKLDESM